MKKDKEEKMLFVTQSAKSALKTTLDNLETQPGQCVRISATSTGHFGLALDKEAQEDQVIKHGEEKILLIDSETAKRLDGVVLDYRDSGEGREFTLLSKEETKQTDK